MNYRQSDNHIKTMDAAVSFLAGNNHQNVAKLFHKSGYTCELEKKGGAYFESVILNKQESKAELTLYWGISIKKEYRNNTENYIEEINKYNSRFCILGIDAAGRFFSKTSESYETEAISPKLFTAMEDACAAYLEMLYGTVEKLACGKKADKYKAPGKNAAGERLSEEMLSKWEAYVNRFTAEDENDEQ